jgi:soluble lytic murein transglycosylase-like protein
MSWWSWLLGFLAGSVLAAWLMLSCGTGRAQSVEVQDAIHEAAVTYGVSERWMLAIARCESRFFPGAVSRGGHQGLFQFSSGTYRWMSAQAGLAGTSAYDPWSAAMVTAWALRNGYASHWSCA